MFLRGLILTRISQDQNRFKKPGKFFSSVVPDNKGLHKVVNNTLPK